MPDVTQTAPVTEQSSTVQGPDWSLLNNLSNNQDVVIEPIKPETPEQKLNTDVVESSQVKPDETAPEKKEETTTPTTEVKPDETQVVKPEFEIKVEDLENAPKGYKEGTYQFFADKIGVDLDKEDPEAFKTAFESKYVPKEKFDEASKLTKEQLLAEYKPEVAAVIEMLEMGMPEELISQPTRVIDEGLSTIDEHLKLGDAELYRRVLEATEGWTPETIDTEIEELVANGKITHYAHRERINLHNDKKVLLDDRNKVLETRQNLINKHSADKQKLATIQKEQQTDQFIKALNDKSDFLGFNIPKEFRELVAQKFRGGQYDNLLNDAQSKADLILFKELGPKYTKLLKETAFAKGRDSEVVRKVNVPTTLNTASGSRTQPNNQTTNNDNPFQLIKEDFGG
jgi:hypothetical protein